MFLLPAAKTVNTLKEPPSYWGNSTADRTYQYDSLGNLVYEQDKGKQRTYYQYNNLNQMTHKTVCNLTSYVENSHEYRYTYDERGNLVLEENCERTTQGNKWITEATYEYNAANRLAIGTNAKGEKSVYTYNGLGQRVRNEYIVQDNGYDYTTFDCTPPSVEVGFEKPEVVVRDFVIDQTSPIEEVLVESEKDGFDYRYTVGLDRISVNVLSPASDTNHERTQTATKQWLHSDRLGSTVNSTDSFGRVTERTDYNEWGEITFHAPIRNTLGYRTINTDRTYTNHDYDVVLGLYYAKARMYDAGEKRFTQVDPIKDLNNWYVYCSNNPERYVDLIGLERTITTEVFDSELEQAFNMATKWQSKKPYASLDRSRMVLGLYRYGVYPGNNSASLGGIKDQSMWLFTAGKIDTEFVRYVKQTNPSLYNQIVENKSLTLQDLQNEEVDIKHMMATLNAQYHDWESIRFASGLGGDLASALKDIEDQTDPNQSLYDRYYKKIMCDDTKISRADVLSDIDAVNIRTLHVLRQQQLKKAIPLHETIEVYYHNTDYSISSIFRFTSYYAIVTNTSFEALIQKRVQANVNTLTNYFNDSFNLDFQPYTLLMDSTLTQGQRYGKLLVASNALAAKFIVEINRELSLV